jgi:uncharacterized membrane protein YphA (DoxX/SURF4 family)
MLTVFPALLDFSEIAVSLLRVTTGLFFFIFGMRLTLVAWQVHDRGFRIRAIGLAYGIAKLTVGVLLTFGMYTQIGAILGAILSLLTFSQSVSTSTNKSGQQVQILLFILCISLLFLGPGLLSIDLSI